jgi:hypothetical protein
MSAWATVPAPGEHKRWALDNAHLPPNAQVPAQRPHPPIVMNIEHGAVPVVGGRCLMRDLHRYQSRRC